MSTIIPSFTDLKCFWQGIWEGGMTSLRQLVIMCAIFLLMGYFFPDLYYLNKESPFPLFFLLFVYGAFLADLMLGLILNLVTW